MMPETPNDEYLRQQIERSFEFCAEHGWVREVGDGEYELTPEGITEACVSLRTDPNVARYWIAFFHNDPAPSERARRHVRRAVLEYFDMIDPEEFPEDWYVQLADWVLVDEEAYHLATAFLLDMAFQADDLALKIAGTLDTWTDDELEGQP